MHHEILDPMFDETQWRPARRRRLVLAAYLDFLIFSVPWGLVVFAARKSVPEASPSLWTSLMVFTVIELALLRFTSWSPGSHLLGIRLVPARTHESFVDRIWEGRLPFVARRLKERESWLTIAAGTLMLNEASKSLIRWTMWTPPVPLFGHQTTETIGAVVAMGGGVIEALIAVSLLGVSVRAALIGIPYYALQLVSAVWSWSLWSDWAGEMMVRRRAYQNLPVRPGEVDMVQSFAAILTVGGALLMLVILALTIPRLLRGARTTIEPNAPAVL